MKKDQDTKQDEQVETPEERKKEPGLGFGAIPKAEK